MRPIRGNSRGAVNPPRSRSIVGRLLENPTPSGEGGRQIWGLIDALIDANEKIVFVVHDWGSALAFDWIAAHSERVKAIVYMEAIVHPFAAWSEWGAATAPIFQGLRSDDGEKMILDDNLFVEKLLFGTLLNALPESAKQEYRKPFLNREDRWPTLSWPRQLPIAGEPPEIIEHVETYGAFMATTEIPKLFINAEPGGLLTGKVREVCRKWKNQTEVTVAGRHFIQEDSGPEIGQIIADWLKRKNLLGSQK